MDVGALRAAARRQLDANCPSLLNNCRFLCERLCEQSSQPGDLLLLATCLERLGEYRGALAALNRIGSSPHNLDENSTFLKAHCQAKLNLPVDAKMTLLFDARTGRIRTALDVRNEFLETRSCAIAKGAIGLHLLGVITSEQNEDEQEAVLFFELAVELDPFLFDARERLAISKGRALRNNDNNCGGQALVLPDLRNADLFAILERANTLLASFQLDEVIALLSQSCVSFGAQQQGGDSTYALALLGRAWFEKADYAQAAIWFERLRSLDANCILGMEYYSTALWHLKRTVDLAFLARDLAERHPLRAQTWIVVGNVFSLEKEHDLAIRFFKRALQLDENCTYAYTLAGHEYIANEDFDQATICYRHALRTDRSHYNAWWGLGTIFARQEKHHLAQLHFERALAIHPTSSVLCCYLGTVLAKMGRFSEALASLDRAKELSPDNPQARFQRARVLFREERWEEALEELEYVRDVVPREASVHMFMGQVCSKLRLKDRAMVHFVAALDLDPKGAASVREAMNQMEAEASYIEVPTQRDFDEEEDNQELLE